MSRVEITTYQPGDPERYSGDVRPLYVGSVARVYVNARSAQTMIVENTPDTLDYPEPSVAITTASFLNRSAGVWPRAAVLALLGIDEDLQQQIVDALSGDSNDDEHAALWQVAEALHLTSQIRESE